MFSFNLDSSNTYSRAEGGGDNFSDAKPLVFGDDTSTSTRADLLTVQSRSAYEVRWRSENEIILRDL